MSENSRLSGGLIQYLELRLQTIAEKLFVVTLALDTELSKPVKTQDKRLLDFLGREKAMLTSIATELNLVLQNITHL